MQGQKQLLYGVAYYDEYMPCERLAEDIRMLKKAGMNVVRIGESTWSTMEPQEGVFDMSHLIRVIEAMGEAGIKVILGTPTYAIPTWMVRSYPDVIAVTNEGRGIYGHRQNMDITHPAYLFYAERAIRKMMETCAHYENVIGVQLDNETKSYGTAGPNVQQGFVKHLRQKFSDDLDAMNAAFGLDYWSNRINAWEDFPDVRGTINGSLGGEFARYQRKLTADFLMWLRKIVEPYLRPDQFITHNTDFNWVGYSHGLHPDTDVFENVKAMTLVGTDIYHPSQNSLTGMEIGFGGDLTRSLRQENYLVLETEAQGFPEWLPFDGQLRLQAYAHLASGANMVEYWHWHSLHNGCETYWKGLLSHDFKENDTYRAACRIGEEWSRTGSHLIDLKKENRIAVLVSNTALTALKWFPINEKEDNFQYNDVLIEMYTALYKSNLECDFLFPQDTSERIGQYSLVVIPALYAASEELLRTIEEYVKNGGHILVTYKSAFADENNKVWHDETPHVLGKVCGISYSHFTLPDKTALRSAGSSGEINTASPALSLSEGYGNTQTSAPCSFKGSGNTQTSAPCSFEGSGKTDAPARAQEPPALCFSGQALHFMECLNLEGANALAFYDHDSFGRYAAVTRHEYGKGLATYMGCGLETEDLTALICDTAERAGLEVPKQSFPVILRSGLNADGRRVRYYMNFSGKGVSAEILEDGCDLLSGERKRCGQSVSLAPWDLMIVESDTVCK